MLQNNSSYYLGNTKIFLEKDAVLRLESLRDKKIYQILLPVKREEYIFREISANNLSSINNFVRTDEDEERLLNKIRILQKHVRSFLAKKIFHKLLLKKEKDTLFQVLCTELMEKIMPLTKKIDHHVRFIREHFKYVKY